MDALHFDTLTRHICMGISRRGLGLLALLSLPGLLALDPADAKKKHKKKKRCPPCKKRKKGKCKGTLPDGTPCSECTECQGGACVAKVDGADCAGGTCQGGECQPPVDPCPGQKLCEGECISTNQCCTREDCPAITGFRCCNGLCTDEKKEAGSQCDPGSHSECCSDYCQDVYFTQFLCAATCRGKECTPEDGCCRGLDCESGHCGGCGDWGAECVSDADCCFSACTARPGQSQKRCHSYAGGPCKKNVDCWSCFAFSDCTGTVDGQTVGICHDGVCLCPNAYECCADADCPPEKRCVFDEVTLRGECKPLVGP